MTTASLTILFQGDSITDAGRDRTRSAPNDPGSMGNGYALLAMGRLLSGRPAPSLAVYNRGISGDCVPDLKARWQRDCIELAPDLLSILIGVNDIWHTLEGRYDGTVSEYETGYRELLQQTRAALPRTRLLIGEPFVLRCGAVTESWFPEFEQRRAVAAQLAREAGATFIPYQAVFDRALLDGSSPERWAADGVHPTPAGHQLMADAWLSAAASSLPAKG